MTFVFVALTVVVVACIGLVVVGRAGRSLADAPPPVLIDTDAAVAWIGDDLSDDVTARVSYADVKAVVGYLLDHLATSGVALAAGEPEELGERATASDHDDPDDGSAGGEDAGDEPVEPIVYDDADGLAYVLGRVSDDELDIDDVDVVEVLGSFLRYLASVGAVGAAVR